MAEQGSFSQEQMNEFLFMQIVTMFQGAALQYMGKVMNPVTQKVERDLAQAKNAIDILGMLETKTQGNLSDGENRMLEHILYELRMNYVDEVNKDAVDDGKTDDAAPDGESSEGEKADGDKPEKTQTEGEEAGAGDTE